MACEVASAIQSQAQRDPVCSAAMPQGDINLRLELPDWDSESSVTSCSSCLSPGAQLDERSPDPRVYYSHWNTSWLQSSLGIAPDRRRQLPEQVEANRSLKVWSLIKDWMGKDISRLSVPVYINEPLSELQKRAEGFESSYLLDQAAQQPARSRERLLLVAAYSVSIYSNLVRTTKPFKELQNSTYELVYPERGYRLLGEKVAHTPATHCLMVEGKRWRFLAYDEMHLEFSLQCYIRIKPVGILSVTFDDGDIYEWNQVPIYITGLVMGPLKLDHKGQSQVVCKATGNRAKLCISSQGTLSRMWKGNNHQVSGVLVEDGEVVPGLEVKGQWDQGLSVRHPDGSERSLWNYKQPELLDSRFKLTKHAMELNELTPGLREKLPATDVRLRPDMRLFEDGYPDQANAEKERLENKQRQERHRREAAGETPRQARWFECVPARQEGELPRWRYRGGYWESREAGRWQDIPDLYGPGGEPKDKAAKGRGSLRAREVLM